MKLHEEIEQYNKDQDLLEIKQKKKESKGWDLKF